ncbi:alanine--tRNA ligase, cytoplasmic isoform X2 [Lepeophtheirus salmonis]
MLGSWSFNDYFKKDAIQFAWEFLTGPLEIPKEFLNVTYFKDDLETREYWLSQGLSPDKIIPKGETDNFWEMGSTGPCGPCTEIHYKDTEIWNLVFMEYVRRPNGELASLDKKHVDTGMGLERLTSILNGYTSNYDTDLFIPIFDKISKLSGADPYSGSFDKLQDINYRILADHSRMIATCLSDGLLPDVSYRLRNIIRRCMKISAESFNSKNQVDFLKELIYCVSESLGDHHREYLESPFLKDEAKLSLLLKFEHDVLKELEKTHKSLLNKLKDAVPFKTLFEKYESELDPSMIGRFYDAFKMYSCNALNNAEPKIISGEFAFKLYDSIGFKSEDIELFALLLDAKYDPYEFHLYSAKVKEQSKVTTSVNRTNMEILSKITLAPKTDDSFKYKWVQSGFKYQFYIIESNILQLIQISNDKSDSQCVGKLNRGDTGILICEKSPFYSEAGGQACDTGSITGSLGESVFHVHDVFSLKGVVYHVGTVHSGTFMRQDLVKLKIDPFKRVTHMQNHTGSHLLNAAMNTVLPFTTQRSLRVDSTGFKFDACIFKLNLSSSEINDIEEKANQMINNADPIVQAKDKYLDSFIKNSKSKVLTLPGEKYPDKVSMICLPQFSEPCCGTHVNCTKDVEALTITHIKSVSSGIKSFRCLTGQKAIDARENGLAFLDNVEFVRQRLEELGNYPSKEEQNNLLKDIMTLKKESTSIDIPHTVRHDAEIILNELKNHLELGDFKRMNSEIDSLLEDTSHLKCIVHDFGIFEYLFGGKRLTNSLSKKIKDKVVFSSVSNGDSVRICALVPKSFRKPDFHALSIIKYVTNVLPGAKTRVNKKNSEGVANLVLIPQENSTIVTEDLLNSITEHIQNQIQNK